MRNTSVQNCSSPNVSKRNIDCPCGARPAVVDPDMANDIARMNTSEIALMSRILDTPWPLAQTMVRARE